MKKKVILSILLGTNILFVWNAISWMVLPFHGASLQNIPEQAIDWPTMQSAMPSSGVYHYPGLPEDQPNEAMNAIESKLKDGPRVTMMVYKNEPTRLLDPSQFVRSLLINLLTVLVALWLVKKCNIQRKSILPVMLTIGLLTAVVSDLALMNWFMMPISYTLINLIDKIIAFGLLGLLFTFFYSKNTVLT